MKLTILAVTKMQNNKICIAGINEAGQWIRPVKELPFHIENKDIFSKDGKQIIYEKFTVIDIPLKKKLDKLPHSEDYIIDLENSTKIISKMSNVEREQFLLKHSENSFFQGHSKEPIKELLEKSKRSLILVGPVIIHYVVFEKDKTPRSHFEIPGVYNTDRHLPCTDLQFITFGKDILKRTNTEKAVLNTKQFQESIRSGKIFLSLGLTREFKGEFHAMIIGAYTLPDYETKINYEEL